MILKMSLVVPSGWTEHSFCFHFSIFILDVGYLYKVMNPFDSGAYEIFMHIFITHSSGSLYTIPLSLFFFLYVFRVHYYSHTVFFVFQIWTCPILTVNIFIKPKKFLGPFSQFSRINCPFF